MLTFAAQYRPAIDSMTAARDLGLRKYKLDQAEWKIVGELRDVLKVCFFFICCSSNLSYLPKDIQGRDTLFLAWNAQSRNGNSGHGSHRQISCHGI